MLLKTTRGFSVCRGLKHLARKKFPWDKKKGTDQGIQLTQFGQVP